jgi:hypothetical protein
MDNRTKAKLAIAITTAMALEQERDPIGPVTWKVLETLDTTDSLDHFREYAPGEALGQVRS